MVLTVNGDHVVLRGCVGVIVFGVAAHLISAYHALPIYNGDLRLARSQIWPAEGLGYRNAQRKGAMKAAAFLRG